MKKEMMNSVKPVEEIIEVAELVDDDAVVFEFDDDVEVAELVDDAVVVELDDDVEVAEVIDDAVVVELDDNEVIAAEEERLRREQEEDALTDELNAMSLLCFLFV